MEFTNQRMNGTVFANVDLSGARFRGVDLSGAKITGSTLNNVDISAEVLNLRVNGVDVTAYVEAELNRRYPDRAKMRPADADGFRLAWDTLDRLWSGTVDKAQQLDPALLHQRVNGEWSFIETLRHLVFATDAWILRTVLGNPAPWSPLDLPHDEMDDIPGVPRDLTARPSLDEVLALRADRWSTVRRFLADLTDDRLDSVTSPVAGSGYPRSSGFPVRECLQVVLNEEWEHRLYAERDLLDLK